MKIIAIAILATLFCAVAVHAQSAPCLVGPSATASQCVSASTYSVTVGTSDLVILQRDPNTPNRTCLFIQALSTNASNVCFAFDQVANATNGPCEELTPGAPFYIYNLPTGNGSPQVPSGIIHALVRTGTGVITYRYCR